MWPPATAAAAIAGALLSQSHQPAVFTLVDVMAALGYGMYLDDNLYQHFMSGIDHLGVLIHPATLRGQQQDIHNMECVQSPPLLSYLVIAQGRFECQGGGNCRCYSTGKTSTPTRYDSLLILNCCTFDMINSDIFKTFYVLLNS